MRLKNLHNNDFVSNSTALEDLNCKIRRIISILRLRRSTKLLRLFSGNLSAIFPTILLLLCGMLLVMTFFNRR